MTETQCELSTSLHATLRIEDQSGGLFGGFFDKPDQELVTE